MHQPSALALCVKSDGRGCRSLKKSNDLGLTTGCKLVIGALLAGLSMSAAAAPADLMDAYVQALDANPVYQAAVAAYHEAAEVRPQALAKLLPQVAASGDVDRVNQSVSGQFFLDQRLINNGQGVNSNRSEYFSRFGYTVGLSQALFHWDLFLGLDQSDLKVAAANLQLLDAQNQLRLGVAEAYFSVLSAQDKQRYAQAEYDALTQLASQTHDRFAAGLLAETDDKQAQAAADNAQALLIAANSGVEIARARLELATGHSYPQLQPLSDDIRLPPPTPNDSQDWVNHARTQNIQVAVAHIKSQIAKYQERIVRARNYPTLDALALREYAYDTGGITNGIGAGNNHQLDQRILLKLKIPIYSGGAIASATRAASAAYEQARAMESASEAKAVHDASVDFLEIQTGRARIAALDQSVASAKAAEDSARTGYQSGTQTYVDLLTALQRRYEAQSNYAQARYAYLINTLKLKDAAGSLSADDLQNINQWLR